MWQMLLARCNPWTAGSKATVSGQDGEICPSNHYLRMFENRSDSEDRGAHTLYIFVHTCFLRIAGNLQLDILVHFDP